MLSTLCALTALTAAVLSHLLVPGFAAKGDPETWRQVLRWSQFFSLTSAIACVIALPLSMVTPLRTNTTVAWSKRLSGVGFAAILLFVVIRAALLPREQTSGQHVFLALGAAHLLGLSLTGAALLRSRNALLRATLSAAFVMTLAAIIGQVLELFMQVNLSITQLQLSRTAHTIGELGYLFMLFGLAALLLAHNGDQRGAVARRLGLALIGMVGAALVLVYQRLGIDTFGLLMYHAQHVRLLLEVTPLVYIVPITLAVASGLSGLLLHRPELHQVALGALLLVASGYCPRSPVQLAWFALGLSMLARASHARAFSDADNVDIPGDTEPTDSAL